MQKLCNICKRIVDSETAPILVIGGYGNPKYICEDCASEFETATTARELDAIKAAMDSIGDKMAKNDIEDETVISTVVAIFDDAKKRANAIEDGTYDFSEEESRESTEAEDEEVPEDLRETAEDKALDEKEKKQNAFMDKIFNWISVILILGGIAFAVWMIFFK